MQGSFISKVPPSVLDRFVPSGVKMFLLTKVTWFIPAQKNIVELLKTLPTSLFTVVFCLSFVLSKKCLKDGDSLLVLQ